MKRVLITGASGFIGRHALTPLLERGYEVHAITMGPFQRAALDSVIWHRVNLLDTNAVCGAIAAIAPTDLLHFAWFVEAGQYWLSTENFRWVEASLVLLRAFRDNGGQRVVMAGSCAEYDWSLGGDLVEESTPRRPVHPYGMCKNALYDLARSFCTRTGISFAWGRIFFVYGPGEPPSKLVSSVAGAILRHETACCGRPGLIRDYLYVEDVASAFVALLDSEVQGSVNIASGVKRTLGDISRKVASMLDGDALLTFGDETSADPSSLMADVRRLHHEVAWAPTFSLEQGLARTIETLRANMEIAAMGGARS